MKKITKLYLVTTLLLTLSTHIMAMMRVDNPVSNYKGSKLMFGCGQKAHNCGIGTPGHPDFYTVDINPGLEPDIVCDITMINLVKTGLLPYFGSRKFDLIVLEGIYPQPQETYVLFMQNIIKLLSDNGKIVMKPLFEWSEYTGEDKKNKKELESSDYIPWLHHIDWNFKNSHHRNAFNKYAQSLGLKIDVAASDNPYGLKSAFALSHCFTTPLSNSLIAYTKHFGTHKTKAEYAKCPHCSHQNFMGKSVWDLYSKTQDTYDHRVAPKLYRIVWLHKIDQELIAYLPKDEQLSFGSIYLKFDDNDFEKLKEMHKKMGYSRLSYAYNPLLPVPDKFKLKTPELLAGVAYDHYFILQK